MEGGSEERPLRSIMSDVIVVEGVVVVLGLECVWEGARVRLCVLDCVRDGGCVGSTTAAAPAAPAPRPLVLRLLVFLTPNAEAPAGTGKGDGYGPSPEPLAAGPELLLPVADDGVDVGTTNAGTATATDGGEGGGGKA